jgi:cytochrome d ubiquinol oxidase subunit II
VFVAAALVLVLSFDQAPLMTRGLLNSRWALPLHLATGIAAIAVFAALWQRAFRVARLAAGFQVSCVFWGWAVSQYPYVVPPDLTIAGAAAPPITLRLTLIALGFGALVLVPSLIYLFRVFKSAPADSSH